MTLLDSCGMRLQFRSTRTYTARWPSRGVWARLQRMRIIAGRHRGRKLLAPEGDVTRPVTDRVKQSIFDVLSLAIYDARVYDCFAGTGSMGLECLSRDAESILFFEADRSALDLLNQNVQLLDDEHLCQIIPGDLFQWFARHPAPAEQDRADIIFLDPPYRFVRERAADLQELARRLAVDHLKIAGTLVFRHDSSDTLELPPLERYDQRKYGTQTVEFWTDYGESIPF